MHRAMALGLGLLALMLAGCSSGGGDPEGHVPDESTILIDGFSFSPATLTVQQGDTVHVHNDHTTAHTVTLVSGERDTGTIAPGAQAQFTMPTPGTHAYRCDIHPQMTGRIIVQE